MSTINPFPLEIVEKINSPQLLAFLQQFGHDKYADAEDINTIVQALNYLYENGPGEDDLKLDQTTPRTGSLIHFFTPQIYNSIASPSASNITNDLTGAKIGIVQKIYSNKVITPTFPAGWVKIGSGTYTPSVLNIIFAEWVGGTRVEYWITKPS